VGNSEAWTHKQIGRVAGVGFHQRIYGQVKAVVSMLAGHVSPREILEQPSDTVRSDELTVSISPSVSVGGKSGKVFTY